jgi:NAD(P)-dependent dehydrogenase (short-subunit alcohol dehydrogenase family)
MFDDGDAAVAGSTSDEQVRDEGGLGSRIVRRFAAARGADLDVPDRSDRARAADLR